MEKQGITFDTGALIALERRHHGIQRVFELASSRGRRMTVPTVVIAEWVRAGVGLRTREKLLRSMIVEELSHEIAEQAGYALGHARGAARATGTIDAIVLMSAWMRGDVVYTSDVRDLTVIRDALPQPSRVRIEHA